MKNESLSWDKVETAIHKEILWLKSNISPSPFETEFCANCIFRQIAMLILSGRVIAKDITSTDNSFWRGEKMTIKKSHGASWHFEMMKTIGGHFKSLGFEVEVEPNLTQGKADLGVHKKNENALFVEVGTISLPKLLVNLKTMNNTKILLVPEENHVIEFSIVEIEKNIKHILV